MPYKFKKAHDVVKIGPTLSSWVEEYRRYLENRQVPDWFVHNIQKLENLNIDVEILMPHSRACLYVTSNHFINYECRGALSERYPVLQKEKLKFKYVATRNTSSRVYRLSEE